MLFLSTGHAFAAQVVGGGDVYQLPKGQVVDDDLYVSAREVIIDGTVKGDLVAAGGYVEVNGVVTGDLMAAAGGINVTGVVHDDARLAVAGIKISGTIDHDLMVGVGGGSMFSLPFPIDNRSITQGFELAKTGVVGGDLYIGGGQGTIDGSIGRNLFAGMNDLSFGGHVRGNADLRAASLQIGDASQVGGTLKYTTPQQLTVPSSVAGQVTAEQWSVETNQAPRRPFVGFLGWLLRTVMILVGLAILGWLLLQLAPKSMERASGALDLQPVNAAIYGVLIAVAVVPVSAALVFLAVLFWGWFPGGIVTFAFLFGFFALIWIFSPLITGLWIGRRIGAATGAIHGNLAALLAGIVVIVLGGRVFAAIPCIGGLVYGVIYLLSFAFAVGGLIIARRPPAVSQTESATV